MPIKLASIGDSLVQGFQDGAIGAEFPLRSFPAIIAKSLGLSVGSGEDAGFRVPEIRGDGLPLDVVSLLRHVYDRTRNDITPSEWLTGAGPAIASYFDEIEDYYERGPGSQPLPVRGVYHNVATHGFTVFESLHLSARECDRFAAKREGLLRDDFLGTPSGAMYRAAKMVLDPSGTRPDASQLDQLDYRVNGNTALGIPPDPPDVLIVWLGANDCLRTVVDLELRDMASDATPDLTLEGRRKYNLTSADVFRRDYEALAQRLDQICGDRQIRVFVGTVPDVTIPPLARGIGELHGKVFDYYVRFFVKDGDEPPLLRKHLKREEVDTIQRRIEGFNEVVRKVVDARPLWTLVDVGAVLQKLAVRRNQYKNPEQALKNYYAAKGQPNHPLLSLDPIPSLLMLRTGEYGNRRVGGLTSLDGIHPTTIGYGIAAEVFLEEMQKHGVPGADPAKIDWAFVIEKDRLALHAPTAWDDFFAAAQHNSFVWDAVFRALGGRV